MNDVGRQLAALGDRIARIEGGGDADRADRLQRLYLKRERLQEKSFRLFRKQIAGRK